MQRKTQYKKIFSYQQSTRIEVHVSECSNRATDFEYGFAEYDANSGNVSYGKNIHQSSSRVKSYEIQLNDDVSLPAFSLKTPTYTETGIE